MKRFFILGALCLGFLSGCGILNNRDIHTQIISNPPGASIYVDGSYEGIAPLTLTYVIDESKYDFMRIGRVEARWRSGARTSVTPRLSTSNSYPKVILNRPAKAEGLEKDLEYVREREEALAEAELQKEIAREYARQARSETQRKAQVSCGLEMMRTGRLPSSNCSSSQTKAPVAPVYSSAITVGGADICPLDPSLGRYSHSTNKGMNKICYYK